mgnify:CR=1 FL=1
MLLSVLKRDRCEKFFADIFVSRFTFHISRVVMLTKRIIPCLDVKDGRVVKGVSFVNLRDAGDPVEVATVYDREGADELCFLDITASS